MRLSEFANSVDDYYTLNDGQTIQVSYRPALNADPIPGTLDISAVDPKVKPTTNFPTAVKPWNTAPESIRQAITKWVAQNKMAEGTEPKTIWAGGLTIQGPTSDAAAAELDLDDELDEDLRKWFREKWVRFGPDGKIRGDCARGSDSEGKPKCLPQSKAHALGKKGRASAAARKRREDPDADRSGPAKNVATKKKTTEANDHSQLDEKCWDTHRQAGMKRKGDRMVPNCVPRESQEQCPECGGAMWPDTMINEKKDACYYKVKSRYKVWPSAYASGALVKCRKKGAKNWGNKSESAEQRFSEPLTGYHIVYRKTGNPVINTPSFETKDQAQKYLMTKMFANHQDYKVVHTADVGLQENWSEKYKRSIDCNNPKGFSQRAHCQGRAKNEAANPAQQAAIAINMKKHHQKPKNEGVAEGSWDDKIHYGVNYHEPLEPGDKITWYHSNHYPEIKGTVVGWKDGHLIVKSVDPSPRNTEKTVVRYRVPKNNILSHTKQGVAEMNVGKRKPQPDTYHIVNKDGTPTSLMCYLDKDNAIKDRDAKHKGAEVHQVGPRGKVKGVAEGYEPGDKVTWYYSNHYPKVEGTVVGIKDGKYRIKSVSPVPGQEHTDPAIYAVPKNNIMSHTKQGVAEGLNEFAPPGGDDGDDGFSEETLKRMAAQWWNGDQDPGIEKTLAAAGWEIGQDEGYDNGGVFVVQAGDINGNSYISWPAEELEGLAEAYPNQQISRYNPDGKTYRGTSNKMPTLDPEDPVDNAIRFGPEHDQSYEQNFDKEELKRVAAKAISSLPKREQQVIKLHIWYGLSFEEIGKRLGVTKDRIRQIEARALRMLKHPERSSDLKSFAQEDTHTAGMAEAKRQPETFGGYDPDDFQEKLQRLKALAGAGPMKTVRDPETGRTRNVPAKPNK